MLYLENMMLLMLFLPEVKQCQTDHTNSKPISLFLNQSRSPVVL